MTEPKYPQVKVALVGQDGNAFSILGRVTQAMRKAGLSDKQRSEFTGKATSGDYDHLLETVMDYVTVEPEEEEDGEYDWQEDYHQEAGG